MVTWRDRCVPLLAFLLTAVYWPGIPGEAVTPRYTLLLIASIVLFPSRVRWTFSHVLLLTFFAWETLSFVWAVDLYGGVYEWVYWVSLVAVFFIGSELQSLAPVYMAMSIGMAVSSLFAILQWFGLVEVAGINDGVNGVAGLFFNPNLMAEPSALVIVGLIAHRIFWPIPLVLPALALPMARGPIVALIASALCFGRRYVISIALLGFAALAFMWRYHSGSVSGFTGIGERFDIWRDARDGLTFLGHGIGSFHYEFPAFGHRTQVIITRPDHAHNDFLEILYETGFIGAALIGAIVVFALVRGKSSADRAVLFAFLLEGLVGYPLFSPTTGFIAALLAGNLANGRYPVFVDLSFRRIVNGAWQPITRSMARASSWTGIPVALGLSRLRSSRHRHTRQSAAE